MANLPGVRPSPPPLLRYHVGSPRCSYRALGRPHRPPTLSGSASQDRARRGGVDRGAVQRLRSLEGRSDRAGAL